MAKEAIEQVRAAETRASELIRDAELEAAEALAKAGEAAKDGLAEEIARAKGELSALSDELQKKQEQALSDAEEGIQKKCADRRRAAEEKKEIIIAQIIEAVKAG